MQLKKYRMEKFIFHVKMFLDKKDTETARLIRNESWTRREMMERSLMRSVLSESNETSPYTHASFHPTFLRATAYVVCSFVKNRTRSFAWKFNQTSLPDEIYLFLAIQLFLTCMCTCMCTRTLVVLERFNFVARHL